MLRSFSSALRRVQPALVGRSAPLSEDCNAGRNRKLEPHPDAEKEPLERFKDDINPKTGERQGPRGPEPTRYGDWERKGRCNGNICELLFLKETYGRCLPILPGLQPIRLHDILPEQYTSNVFLGFTADGRYVVSYNTQRTVFKLSFWLVDGPPSSWLKEPFAVLTYKLSNSIHFEHVNGVRFIQSLADPQTFVVISTDGAESVFVVWGTLPEPSCYTCRNSSQGTPCSRHFLALYVAPYASDTYYPCAVHRNWPKKCVCMPYLSGTIQPSVCPKTGRLRIAWISNFDQVHVMSCSFHTNPDHRSTTCILPMGSYARQISPFPREPPPLARCASFLTSNYCSRCYSWLKDDARCRNSTDTCPVSLSSVLMDESIVNIDYRETCVFSSLPILIAEGSSDWPEGHRHPRLPAHNYVQDHECSQKNSGNMPWRSSLLIAREHLISCQPLNYLAMLQDIQASYIHWALVPLSKEPTSLNDDLGSRIDLSADGLLLNHLSGQCHSYFDAQNWRHFDSTTDSSQPPLLVHLEEVLLDFPEPAYSRSIRLIYASPMEPDWILLYDADNYLLPQDGKPMSPHTSSLVAVINIATGQQLDPDEPSVASRVRAMAARCPSSLRFSSTPTMTNLLELNNVGLLSDLRSVDRLLDPQGGFVLRL